MSRGLFIVLLCLFAASGACARRKAAGAQISAAPSVAQKTPGSERAGKMRDALRTLKEKIRERATPEQRSAPPAGTPTTADPAGTPPPQVGTGGSWSVENRYPHAPSGGSAAGSAPQSRGGRMLSRAPGAARHATGDKWLWVAVLSALAAIIAVVLAVRRTRPTA